MSPWASLFRDKCRMLGLGVAIGTSTPAYAALVCTFTITNIDFGTINLAANNNFDTTGTLTASCTGGTAKSTVRICPNLNAGSGGTTTGNPRFMLTGSTTLNYNMYVNAGRTQVWGSYLWGFSFTPPTINLSLNASGNGSASDTIYARTSSGQQNNPSGTYTSSFSGADVQIAYAQSTVGSCTTIGAMNATSAPFTVTASYPAACSVSSTTLTFASTGVLNTARDGSSTLTATCTIGAPYTIGLSGGNAGASDPTQRKMSKGGEQITYGLYRDAARAQPWGDTVGVNTAADTGTGLGQTFTVYGRIPAQATPSPGAYSDTIVTTITY